LKLSKGRGRNLLFLYQRRNRMIKFFYLLIFFVFLFVGCSQVETAKIQNGEIDLAGVYIEETVLELSGDWEFYWKLTPEDIRIEKNLEPEIIAVPGKWKFDFFGPQKTKGYGTYHLKVKNIQSNMDLSLYVPSIWSAYELYINQEKIYQMGSVSIEGDSFVPEKYPLRLNIPGKPKEFDIYIIVYDHLVGVGGIELPILLSTTKNIKDLSRFMDFEHSFFIGMIFMMSFFYMAYFFLNKENLSFFYFASFSFAIGFREVLVGQRVLVQLLYIPFSLSYRLDNIFKFLVILFFTKFIRLVFPQEINLKFEKFVTYFLLIISGLILFLDFSSLYWLEVIFRLLFPLLCFYFVLQIFIAYHKKREDAEIYLFSFVVISIVSVNDILHSFRLINTGYFLVYAYLMLLFLQSFLISKRTSNSYRELKLMGNQLKKIGKVKDDFMSNLSHEMRTPLSLIYAFSELLVDNPKADPETIESYSRDIHRETKSLIEIINDLMMVTDLETKYNLIYKGHNIYSLVREASEYLESFKDESKVTINCEGDESAILNCDKSLLIKVLIIIIKNSIVYNRQNGKVHIHWFLEVDGTTHIVVSDNGFGIPTKDLPFIFDKFFRVDNSITYKVSGVGVGLFIAKRILELHDGDIYVESKIGEGTSLHLLFPKNI
jgi:signal transduction histidine kinase